MRDASPEEIARATALRSAALRFINAIGSDYFMSAGAQDAYEKLCAALSTPAQPAENEPRCIQCGWTAPHVVEGQHCSCGGRVARSVKLDLTSQPAENDALVDALDWALAEIDGRTRYHPTCVYTAEEWRKDALDKARAALNRARTLDQPARDGSA